MKETLRRWTPATAHAPWPGEPDDWKREEVNRETVTANKAFLVTWPGISSADNAALMRAAELNGCATRLFEPDMKYAAADWYQDIPRIVDILIECVVGDDTFRLEPGDSDRETTDRPNGRADKITVVLAVEHRSNAETIRWSSDLAFQTEEKGNNPAHCGLLVTRTSSMSRDCLETILRLAMYDPILDNENDAIDTQDVHFHQDAHLAACNLLLDPIKAVAEIVRNAADLYVTRLVPHDHAFKIRRRHGRPEIEVTIEPPQA